MQKVCLLSISHAQMFTLTRASADLIAPWQQPLPMTTALTMLFVPPGSLEKEVEELSAIVNTLNKSFVLGCHAVHNQYTGWLWVCGG